MIKNLVITKNGLLLDNWVSAFPKIVAVATVEDANLVSDQATIIWLHSTGSEEWLTDCLTKLYLNNAQATVVVISNMPDQLEASKILSAGALGYCHAYSAPKVLTQVRSIVSKGGVWVGRDMLQYLILSTRQLVSTAPDKVETLLARLSPREQEVAQLVSQGFSNKQIARDLAISERTVKAHITSCFGLLNVNDRLQLALILNKNESA